MINIRKANISDCKSLMELTKQLGYEATETQTINRLELLHNKGQEVLIAENGNEILGYISFTPYHTIYMDPGLCITALVVDEKHRNNGIGKSLINEAEIRARKHGFCYLRLYSNSTRLESHEFYRKMGFSNETKALRFIKELES